MIGILSAIPCLLMVLLNFWIYPRTHQLENLLAGTFCLACAVYCLVYGVKIIKAERRIRCLKAECEELKRKAGLLR
jgi:hypothetical protein